MTRVKKWAHPSLAGMCRGDEQRCKLPYFDLCYAGACLTDGRLEFREPERALPSPTARERCCAVPVPHQSTRPPCFSTACTSQSMAMSAASSRSASSSGLELVARHMSVLQVAGVEGVWRAQW